MKSVGTNEKGRRGSKLLRLLACSACILLFCAGIWAAVNTGFSRLFSYTGEAISNQRQSQAVAEQLMDLAVRLSPVDPSVHYSRALVMEDAGNLPEALREFEVAAALRPRDYIIWQKLGVARDQAGDEQGAIVALNEAVRRAPYYAQPHWQLGNILFRAGRYEEAFAEMRKAVVSDYTLLPNFIDLTWSAYRGDANAVEQVIRPEGDDWRLALTKFYARKGKADDAARVFRTISAVSSSDRQELVNLLLKAKGFQEAYEIWKGGASGAPSMPAFINGGFEERVSLDEQSFGWQVGRNIQGVSVSQDAATHHSGAYSLRVEWSGDSHPDALALSQIILTEPEKRYRIKFVARTEHIVSAALPIIIITDMSGSESRVLAQSKPLPENADGWGEYSLEFTAPAGTEAVRVSLRRENCSTTPCPAFGKVWVDDFEIHRLN